jgi:CheY-like chemotaxis protein
VTTANNGREAVEVVKATESKKGPFDIVLMDQEMPVLDGNGATKEIRRLEEAGEVERIPILGVTANVRGEQTEQMLRSGMDDIISKPYKIDELVSRLLDLINRKKVNGGDESES